MAAATRTQALVCLCAVWASAWPAGGWIVGRAPQCGTAAVLPAWRRGAERALRGGASEMDDGDDGDAARFVRKSIKRHQPEELSAATEYLSRKLRAQAASNAGCLSVGVGRGHVEVRFGNASMDASAQEQDVLDEMRRDGGRSPYSPIERMRQELHDRLEHEDALSRQFFDVFLARNYSAAFALLEAGADPNWRHPHHHLNTALHKAAAAGDMDAVGFLLDNGASVHVTNMFGDTPVMASAGGAGMEPVSGIEKDEWSADWQGGEKPSLEVQTWAAGLYEVSKALLDAGALLQHQNNYSNTPLHKAAANGFPRNVELFLRGGADVNAANQLGETPLHLAAFGGHFGTTRVLVEHGADVNARDAEMNTPLWEANQLGRTKVQQYLRRFTHDLSFDPHLWGADHQDSSSEADCPSDNSGLEHGFANRTGAGAQSHDSASPRMLGGAEGAGLGLLSPGVGAATLGRVGIP